MKDINNNIVAVKSKNFALRIINLYRYLTDKTNQLPEYVMSKQLLRSGTSIGANVFEALQGQSKADFGSKMNISLKEAYESIYWIELLTESEYLTQCQGKSLRDDCEELIKLLSSIVKSTFHSIN